jgi:hypothetical protein
LSAEEARNLVAVAGQAKADASSAEYQYHHADAEARLAGQVNEVKKARPTTGRSDDTKGGAPVSNGDRRLLLDQQGLCL